MKHDEYPERTLDVLLVEDNDAHADLLGLHVRRLPRALNLVRARSFAEAIDTCRKTRIDCILLDLGLPDSPIPETLPRMRDAFPQLPIVVLTSTDDLELASKSLSDGAQDFLVKSTIDADRLLRALRYGIERKKVSLEIERQKRQLERRNEELQSFAHLVAHELKQPLHPILINCHMLRRKLEPVDASVDTCLERVESAVRDMSTLVEDMLAFAAIERERERRDRVDLNAVLREVLDDLAVTIDEKGAEVAVERLPVVSGHARLLRQTFVNLVSNALKYGPPAVSPRIAIGTVSRADAHEISVTDNGVGIAPEDLPHVFDMFRRVGSNPEVGHGIGLAYCRRILEHHGGHIRVESKPACGSTFVLSLPRRSEDEGDQP